MRVIREKHIGKLVWWTMQYVTQAVGGGGDGGSAEFDGLVSARKPDGAVDMPWGADSIILKGGRKDGHMMQQTLFTQGAMRRGGSRHQLT